jgi:hypothetical protein
MNMTIRTNIELPSPILTYFATDTADAVVARCFSEDGVVVDEGRTYRGRVAIARWKTDAAAKYHYMSEPVSADVSGAEAIVTARVTGDFPGSPVTLRYRFTLENGAIVRLEITG